jgi:hypothetical protein
MHESFSKAVISIAKFVKITFGKRRKIQLSWNPSNRSHYSSNLRLDERLLSALNIEIVQDSNRKLNP